ncbi:hypothetical protein HDV62DRAFT_259572 [Trichoderma sp. SZMC 28011]
MPKSAVLLNALLPINAVKLGRLVLDIRFPDQDFFEPEDALITENTITQKLENIHYSNKREKATGVNSTLSNILFGNHDFGNGSDIDLSSSICMTHQLQNSGQFFEWLCTLKKARSWLERAIRRRNNVYLITGIKTIANASIDLAQRERKGSAGNVRAPTGLAANIASMPLPDKALDLSFGWKRSVESSEKASFTAPGEQVFAVQYRKVRISWFSSRDVDKTYLESGNRWELYLGGRGEDDEGGKFVDMEVGDYIQDGDIKRPHDMFDVGGDEYFRIR